MTDTGYVPSEVLPTHGHHKSQEHPSTEEWQPANTHGVTLAIEHTTQFSSSSWFLHPSEPLEVILHFGLSECSQGHQGREGPVREGPVRAGLWRDLGLTIMSRHIYQFMSRHLADLFHAKFLPDMV